MRHGAMCPICPKALLRPRPEELARNVNLQRACDQIRRVEALVGSALNRAALSAPPTSFVAGADRSRTPLLTLRLYACALSRRC